MIYSKSYCLKLYIYHYILDHSKLVPNNRCLSTMKLVRDKNNINEFC